MPGYGQAGCGLAHCLLEAPKNHDLIAPPDRVLAHRLGREADLIPICR